MLIVLLGLAWLVSPVLARAPETCTYSFQGKLMYTFACRWLVAGTPPQTIFVDNHNTGDRYMVEESQWQVIPNSACIKKRDAMVCNAKKWW